MIRFVVLLILAARVGYAESVQIAVASSMQKPVKEVIAAFHANHPGCEAQMIIGSSGKLTAQIMNGAPYDLFLSADMTYPEYLAEQGKAAAPVYSFAEGTLVLWSPKFSFPMLTNDRVRRIAVANPRSAPYGRAALEVMKRTGIYEAIKDKLVFAENVAQVSHYIESGAADAGFLSMTCLPNETMSGTVSFSSFSDAQDPIRHGLVALTDPRGNDCVSSFLSFMKSDESVRIFTHYGFKLSKDDDS